MRSKLDSVLILMNLLASYVNIVLLTVLQIDPSKLNGLTTDGQQLLFVTQVMQQAMIIVCVIYLSFFYKVDEDITIIIRLEAIAMIIWISAIVSTLFLFPTTLNPSPVSPNDNWCCCCIDW